MGGGFGDILDHFKDIQSKGPPRGYFQEPNNSNLVVAPINVPRAEEFFLSMGVKIVTRSNNLEGFVGDVAAEESWLEEKVKGWEGSVKTLAGVAHNHPQPAYIGLQKSLQ